MGVAFCRPVGLVDEGASALVIIWSSGARASGGRSRPAGQLARRPRRAPPRCALADHRRRDKGLRARTLCPRPSRPSRADPRRARERPPSATPRSFGFVGAIARASAKHPSLLRPELSEVGRSGRCSCVVSARATIGPPVVAMTTRTSKPPPERRRVAAPFERSASAFGADLRRARTPSARQSIKSWPRKLRLHACAVAPANGATQN